MAHAIARHALPEYAHRCSPKKFTQHQLFACLVLKIFYQLDYRGVVALLEDSQDLREIIELHVVPHYTTRQKAFDRLLVSKRAQALLDATVTKARCARLGLRKGLCAAIDGSGFEAHHISHYFVRRRAKGSKSLQKTSYRCYPSIGTVVDIDTHVILSVVPGRGPGPDINHLIKAVEEARARVPIGTLLADAGYDAEWSHAFLREHLGIRSIIPAKSGRPTEKLPTSYWRRRMATRFNRKRYGQRWQVETVYSMIKRRLGESVAAKGYWRQCRALMLKAIAHNILILRWGIEVFYRAGPTDFTASAFAFRNRRRGAARISRGGRGMPASYPRRAAPVIRNQL